MSTPQLEHPFNVHLDSPPVERWRVVEEAPRYFVSNRGRLLGPKGIRQPSTVDGYYIFDYRINGVRQHLLMHRAVAKAFIPNPEEKPQVNHLDGVRTHNDVGNLEWATRSEDMLHRYRVLRRTPPRGETHWHSKLTPEQVLQIRSLRETHAKEQIAAMFGITRRHVRLILNRIIWRHLP